MGDEYMSTMARSLQRMMNVDPREGTETIATEKFLREMSLDGVKIILSREEGSGDCIFEFGDNSLKIRPVESVNESAEDTQEEPLIETLSVLDGELMTPSRVVEFVEAGKAFLLDLEDGLTLRHGIWVTGDDGAVAILTVPVGAKIDIF